MSFSKIVLLTSCLFVFECLIGQECELNITGQILDVHESEPLSLANIYIKDLDRGTTSDNYGNYKITGLCPGDLHLVVSHIACEPIDVFIRLKADTIVNIILDHGHTLEDVVISDERNESLNISREISRQDVQDQGDKNLATMLEDLNGVSVIRNGNAIAKPVVQGLTGNRLSIINNGVPQSGQQWGNDHSPEIDPLNAGSIRVVKGVGSIEYQASNLGALVLVEPLEIGTEPHLHGQVSSFFESNGRGAGLNLRLRENSKAFAWAANGTIKKSGDKHSPDYFLNNTGNEEMNFAIQLKKVLSDSTIIKLYLSSFNAEFGVLRGSHISNPTSLQEAIGRAEPFFTEEEFSYGLEAPKQKANHQLAKAEFKKFLRSGNAIDLNASFQLNNRKEFDIRRGNRTSIPSLDLRQTTFYSSAKYSFKKGDFDSKIGLQTTFSDNTNNPETGILPLIPDYTQSDLGAFYLIEKKTHNWSYGFGARYDFVFQDMVRISGDLPRRIIRNENIFHKLAGSLNLSKEVSEDYKIDLNVGFIQRNPAVNELYSQGLHQGVSGIEEGDTTLTTESAIKISLRNQWVVSKRTSLELLAYANWIQDFINLESTGETRLTIRGAFPVFKYSQANATLNGLEIRAKHSLSENLDVSGNYSFLSAMNRITNLPIQFMPANNLRSALTYRLSPHSKTRKRTLENAEIKLNYRYVFQQNTDLNQTDFLNVPDAYGLFGIKISGDIQAKKKRWRMVLKVENVFNTTYRDYLNRLRYYADDLGRNVSLLLRLSI